MHGGEADLEHFLSKEKEEREYCRSVEQVWADDQSRPRDARDKAVLNRWAVGMGLKHPDSTLTREKLVPLACIDKNTPPFLGTPGGGVFSNFFKCGEKGNIGGGSTSIPVRVAARSGKKVGNEDPPHSNPLSAALPPPTVSTTNAPPPTVPPSADVSLCGTDNPPPDNPPLMTPPFLTPQKPKLTAPPQTPHPPNGRKKKREGGGRKARK